MYTMAEPASRQTASDFLLEPLVLPELHLEPPFDYQDRPTENIHQQSVTVEPSVDGDQSTGPAINEDALAAEHADGAHVCRPRSWPASPQPVKSGKLSIVSGIILNIILFALCLAFLAFGFTVRSHDGVSTTQYPRTTAALVEAAKYVRRQHKYS